MQDITTPNEYKLNEVYQSHNDYWGGRGICMGASARWCRAAIQGNYLVDPCTDARERQLATLLTIEFGVYAKRQGIHQPTDRAQVEPWIMRTQEQNLERLVMSLGFGAQTIPSANNAFDEIVSYIASHPGIYLLMMSTHVTGACSIPDSCFYYDNQCALFTLPTKYDIKPCIRAVRNAYDPYELGLTRANGYGWAGVRLVP